MSGLLQLDDVRGDREPAQESQTIATMEPASVTVVARRARTPS